MWNPVEFFALSASLADQVYVFAEDPKQLLQILGMTGTYKSHSCFVRFLYRWTYTYGWLIGCGRTTCSKVPIAIHMTVFQPRARTDPRGS